MKIDLREEVLREYDKALQEELKEHWNNGPEGGFGDPEYEPPEPETPKPPKPAAKPNGNGGNGAQRPAES